MIEIKDKKDCCGCWACADVCPVACISMPEDEEGFRYPLVDKEKCIDCHLCEKVCPVINVEPEVKKTQHCYVLQHKDDKILKESTSGGAFTAIASWVIEQGGVVFGAGFDDKFQVVHQYTETIDGLSKFRNSKYVQSLIGRTYIEVRDFLKNGRLVCFSGTPCQLEGLLCFLRKPYDNLITIDIACYSVTSPKIFREYLDEQKERFGADVQNVKFRDKQPFGYNYSQMSIYRDNKQIYHEGVDTDAYLRSFVSGVNVRPSCFDCRFKKQYRLTDFTIWDCYDVRPYSKQMDDNRGVTRVLAHTKRAVDILDKLKDRATIIEIPVDEAMQDSKELVTSIPMNNGRETFFHAIQNRNLFTIFPTSSRTRTEKIIRVMMSKMGIYTGMKKLAKKFIKNLKRS